MFKILAPLTRAASPSEVAQIFREDDSPEQKMRELLADTAFSQIRIISEDLAYDQLLDRKKLRETEVCAELFRRLQDQTFPIIVFTAHRDLWVLTQAAFPPLRGHIEIMVAGDDLPDLKIMRLKTFCEQVIGGRLDDQEKLQELAGERFPCFDEGNDPAGA